MSYAIVYDPCFKCEHKDTKKMCTMCELTYYRNQHVSKEATNEQTPKLSDCFDWKDTQKELEEYIDKKFEEIKTTLEELYE